MEGGMPGIFVDLATSAFRLKLHQRDSGYVLTQLVQPGDHVIFFSIDRGFRNLADWSTTMESWRARGIKPHFVSESIDTTTASGEAMADFLAVAAKNYSRVISERTKEALLIRKMRLKGKPISPKQAVRVVDSEWVVPEQETVVKEVSGKVYIYERVSHESSYISGLGLEAQAARNESYAKRLIESNRGLTLGERFVDEAVSAYKVAFGDRPAGKKLLAKLKKGDHLVVYKIDRAWRRVTDAVTMLEDLKKKGVTIHFSQDGVDCSTHFGETWVAMMSFAAKMESDMKACRSREVNRVCREKGRPLGEAPYGFKTKVVNGEKKLVVDKEKVRRCAIMWVLREEYGYRWKEASDIYAAMYYHKHDKWPQKITLRCGLLSKAEMTKLLRRANRVMQAFPPKLWEKYCAEARAAIAVPVPEKYLIHCPVPQPWGPSVSDESAEQPLPMSESHIGF
jgi:putative DNA-invertase from lambdoid prophage Rac